MCASHWKWLRVIVSPSSTATEPPPQQGLTITTMVTLTVWITGYHWLTRGFQLPRCISECWCFWPEPPWQVLSKGPFVGVWGTINVFEHGLCFISSFTISPCRDHDVAEVSNLKLQTGTANEGFAKALEMLDTPGQSCPVGWVAMSH